MSTLRNKVNLIGHIGQTPETKSFDSGKCITRFSLATNERFKNKAGEWQEKTEWHSIYAWGKAGENLAKIADKGSEIVVEGKIVHKQFETKSGEKRQISEVELQDFYLINKKDQKSK